MQSLCKIIQLSLTDKIWDAVEDVEVHLKKTEQYEGLWLRSDTLRHLVFVPYVEHNYPRKNTKKAGLRGVKVTEDDYNHFLSLRRPDEPKLCLSYRLIVSGLKSYGYLRSNTEDIRKDNYKRSNFVG